MKLFILFLFLLFCGSCVSENDTKVIPYPNKIGSYISCYITNLEQVTLSGNIINDNKLNLLLSGTTETFGSYKFKELSRYFGDIYSGYCLPTNIEILSDSINSIHIYTLKDIDEKYNSDSCVDHLFIIEYQSFYDLIQGQYDETMETDFKLSLNQFNAKKTKLFGNNFSLYFADNAQSSKKYSFVIEIETSLGIIRRTLNDIVFNK